MILVIDGIFYYPTSHQAFIMWSHVGGRALFREEPLEEGMAAHSSILAWRFHGQWSLVGCSPQGCKESGTTEGLSTHV